jgi:hypothetical protein
MRLYRAANSSILSLTHWFDVSLERRNQLIGQYAAEFEMLDASISQSPLFTWYETEADLFAPSFMSQNLFYSMSHLSVLILKACLCPKKTFKDIY